MQIIQIVTLAFLTIALTSCTKPEPPYQDLTHQSRVFGKTKYYRLYLPKGYDTNTRRYPVVYFFHGWGGRHFKDDNARLEYEKIKVLVDKYQTILVMWDGNYEESEPRPYNIGNHDNITSQVQMRDYFPELIAHIDSTYRTVPDRVHRAIIGFSMGGFLSYFLAGEYPDKVCAAVNMTGSPEFFVGTPEVHTLFPVRHAFKNLRSVRLRFHNSTADELTLLNAEVDRGARREGGLSYEYWQFVGGHVVDKPGETQVFERALKFVAEAFANPLPVPDTWSHYDLYPSFRLWDYSVTSDKNEPGYIYMNNVSAGGFGISTMKWLPDGPPLNNCKGEVITAARYRPSGKYLIKSLAQGDVKKQTVTADAEGRLHLAFDQSGADIGISVAGDGPELTVADYTIGKESKMIPSQESKMSMTVFNRTGTIPAGASLTIRISSNDSAVAIYDSIVSMRWPGGDLATTGPIRVSVNKAAPIDGSPSAIKLMTTFNIDTLAWHDEIDIPVRFNATPFPSIEIDDGRKVNDSVAVFGRGNGNGIAEPGEEIMIYTNGHRTKIYTDDPWVVRDAERMIDEVLPAKWPDGFTVSSVVKIDARCPKGHTIGFLCDYETKSFMPIGRHLTWGEANVTVGRK